MKINVLKRQFQHQLLTCGKPIEDPHCTILNLLTQFASGYQSAIDGTGNWWKYINGGILFLLKFWVGGKISKINNLNFEVNF